MARLLLIAIAVVLIGAKWATDPVLTGHLLTEVPVVKELPWLESHLAYFYVHLFALMPVIAFSFERRVQYYKNWKYLFPAILITGAVFILWDVFFTARGVWGFNHRYLMGPGVFGLPWEELLFFFSVPFACVFIYENLHVKKGLKPSLENGITRMLILAFLTVGLCSWSKIYTFTTFMLSGLFLLYHHLFIRGKYLSRFYLTYLITWIPFMIVNGVLTGGYTREPIVLYNPEEYLGIRISSIPVDDSVYSFLLLLSIISLFEHFRKKSERKELSSEDQGYGIGRAQTAD